MKRNSPALLLAAAMIAIALLAIFDVIPRHFALWAPVMLLAIFPRAWLGRRACGGGGRP